MHRKKKRTTVNLPEELVERAKEENINLSRTLENALRKKLSFSADAFSEKGSRWTRRDSNPGLPPCEELFSEKSSQKTDDFVEDFGQTMEVAWGLADSTIEQRLRTARNLIDFLDGHPLKASRSDVLDFLEERDTQAAYKGVRVIYGRYFDTDLAADVRIPQSPPKNHRIPKDAELRETFEALPNDDHRTMFLLLASSGLRRGEAAELTWGDIEREKRMIRPGHDSATKRSYVTFYNSEAEELLEDYGLPGHIPQNYTEYWPEWSKDAAGVRIGPQDLRRWFCESMRDADVAGEYIDAFAGRVPKTVRGRHYSDFSPENLRKVYEGADLKVLER